MRLSHCDLVVGIVACFLPIGLAQAEWNSVGACGQTCSTAGQACADAAAFHHRELLAMYGGYSQGRLVGYFCDLSPFPINIGDSFTGPVCDLLTEAKDATTAGGCIARLEPQQLGDDECGQVGNPVTVVNGNKYLEHTDFESDGYEHLAFTRFYNSLEQPTAVTTAQRPTLLGTRWRTNWDSSIGFISTFFAIARSPDGQEIEFVKSQGQWKLSNSNLDLPYRLLEDGGMFRLTDGDDSAETYDASGRLMSRRTLSGYMQSLTYSPDGKLAEVTDSYGRTLRFAYAGGYVSAMTAPENLVFGFDYQPINNYNGEPKILRSVIYPDSTPENPDDNPRLTYLYEDGRFPQAVTGIIDENNRHFATYAYDASGRGIATMHGDGADSYTVEYTTANTRTVTNPLGKQTIFHYSTIQGIPRVTHVDGVPNGTCEAASKQYAYDAATGMIKSRTDWKENRTDYVYNSRGLQESRTEAADTPLARTITTSWHPDFRLPTLIVAPGVTTTFTYDPNGRLLVKAETDTTDHVVPYSTNGRQRSWSYTYSGSGQVATVDGPRTDVLDVTSYAYDGAGNLVQVTNALGHATRITEHDPRGLPRTVLDPNNVPTTLAYNERGWLASHTFGGAATAFDYAPNGTVAQITLPNGASFSYEYDAAQRLMAIENNAGERIELTLDGMGNATAILVKNSDGQILYRHHRVFDALGRLLKDIGAQGQTVVFGHDKNDNQTSVLNARQFTTSAAFDALDRLHRMTDGLIHDTQFTYDARDKLVGVIDPRGVPTRYVYNGFGELIYESSHDAGIVMLQRDSAGNITQRLDARGVATLYTHDALGRRLTEIFPESDSENRLYVYDNPRADEYGIGRLYQVFDDSGITRYVYDLRGNPVRRTQFIKGLRHKGATCITGFSHDAADQLIQLIYPSGRIVDYGRDSLGRVVSVTTRANALAPAVEIATDIAYSAYGAVIGWVYGNGLQAQMNYDLDYRLVDIVVLGDATTLYDVHLAYDGNGNIEGISDALSEERSQSFAYDELDRLTEASSGCTGDGVYGVESFSYDAAGNRSAKGGTGGHEAYSYEATSNRLVSIAEEEQAARQFGYDAAGNVVSDESSAAGAVRNLRYNGAGRYAQLIENGQTVAAYRYNALGERVMKAAMPPRRQSLTGKASRPGAASQPPSPFEGGRLVARQHSDDSSGLIAAQSRLSETHYHYDLSRTLIAESTDGGAALREYVYLPEGTGGPAGIAMPLAQIDNTVAEASASRVSFIISDHLHTPVAMADLDGQVVWRRTHRPFGETAEEQGPSSTNIRFPGQYFDAESGYRYNMFRDYEASLGRYLQSDPIGISGGWNRYTYVGGDPLGRMDPWGLRGLTPSEKAKLSSYIPRADLDCADLHIGKVPWFFPDELPPEFVAVTLGNDIYVRDPRFDTSSIWDLGTLGHELVHVGQYAREGLTYLDYVASRTVYGTGRENPWEGPAYKMGAKIRKDFGAPANNVPATHP